MEHPAVAGIENAQALLVGLLNGTAGRQPRIVVEQALTLLGAASLQLQSAPW